MFLSTLNFNKVSIKFRCHFMFNEISGSSIMKIVAASADVIVLIKRSKSCFSPDESRLKLIGSPPFCFNVPAGDSGKPIGGRCHAL